MKVKQLHILAIICFGLAYLFYLIAVPLGSLLVSFAIMLELIALGLLIVGDYG